MADFWTYLIPVAFLGYLLWRRRSAQGPDAKALLARGAQIVDVRTAAEFRGNGHPRALNIPLDELAARRSELDPSRPVLVCCESGSRSALGAALLRRSGFTEVANLGSWRRIHDLLS